MSKNYIATPRTVSIKDVSSNGYCLSAGLYKGFNPQNIHLKYVRDFLARDINNTKDLGCEPGSSAYTDNSPYVFMKTKALQPTSYIPDFTAKSSTEHIVPQAFKQMNLHKGDLLIVKDGAVGEIVMLDKDYPNMTISSGIYKLPVKEHPLYLLAFVKSNVFKEQIDFMVPKGSTLRHGKTKFLDCQIPIPNTDVGNTIRYVEMLMQAIVDKEIAIKTRYSEALSYIENELQGNQSGGHYTHKMPNIFDIMKNMRLDAALYDEDIQRNVFQIKNYGGGCATLDDLGCTDKNFIRGNNLAVSVIGASHYSDVNHIGFYPLYLPKNISAFGTINKMEYFGNPSKLLLLKKGSIIFGAEGTFRSYLFLKDEQAITNFHGLSIYIDHADVYTSVFIKLMLDYMREKGILQANAVGGNGGSLAINYLRQVKFPKFPDSKQKILALKYYNPDISYDSSNCNINTFEQYDHTFTSKAAIQQLDEAKRYLQELLDKAIFNITDDYQVDIRF